jgi:hypothetical protein
VKKFFGTGNYGGTSQKGQRKRLLVNWFHGFHTHFPPTLSRNQFETVWQGVILVTTANKQTRFWKAFQNTGCVRIFVAEIQVCLQPRKGTVTGWSHDLVERLL